MQCVTCGYENVPGNSTCVKCGAILRRAVAKAVAVGGDWKTRFQKLEVSEFSRPPGTIATTDRTDWLASAEKRRRRGDFAGALRDYSRAIEEERAVPAAWAGQARMLIALGDIPHGQLWARKGLELFPIHADLHAALAQSLSRGGDLVRAQAASDASLRGVGRSVYPWLARGDLLLAQHDPLADHCFNKAVELSRDWLTEIEIAEILLHHRRYAAALPRCQRAVGKAADEFYPWLLQARCEFAMGMTDAGHRSLGQCRMLDPHAQIEFESSRFRGWVRRLMGTIS